MKRPLVSICLRSYNNQDFILEALRGILIQNVNFKLELIYSDDCSDDNSFKLVEDAIKNDSKFVNVHLVRQSENLGMIDNLLYILNKSSGVYIAMCDGDDYWSDPEKLQLQVNFLEANPGYEVCFTNVFTINEGGKILKEKLIKEDCRTDYEMQHLPTWVPVSSKVFRNRDFNSLSRTVPGDDMYMLLSQSKHGKIKFLNVVTGAYRYQSRSAYSSKNIVAKKDYMLKTHIECMELVTKNLYPKYQKLILKKIIELRYLDKELYLSRLIDLKSFMKKYPNRFSTWETIKIRNIVGILRILDLAGIHVDKRLMLKIVNKTI